MLLFSHISFSKAFIVSIYLKFLIMFDDTSKNVIVSLFFSGAIDVIRFAFTVRLFKFGNFAKLSND